LTTVDQTSCLLFAYVYNANQPKESQLKAVKRIFKHLARTKDLLLWYPIWGNLEIIGYFVAADKKSTLVPVNFLNNVLCHVILRCKLQWPYSLLRLNILLLEHVVLKFYELGNNSETFDWSSRNSC